MNRPSFLFFCSNGPYYAILFLAVSVCLILLAKILDTLFVLGFNFNFILTYFFEPFLIAVIISTSLSSIVVYIFYWADLAKRNDIDDNVRGTWKKKFIRTTVLVNSFYYDFKYGEGEKHFLFEEFIKRSRDKLAGL